MNKENKQYIEDIIKKHTEERKKYDKEYKIASIKNWLGGIIIIGSTLIPGTAILKLFGGLAKMSPVFAGLIPIITNILIKNIKFSKPLLRQIVANALKKAVLQGGVYGGMYGIGYSIHQDMDFKETVETITDSIISAIVFNVLLSSAALSLRLTLGKGKDILYNFERRKDWGVVFKKASGNPELAIKTLLKYHKGFVPKAAYKKGIGYIDFPWGWHNIFTDKGFGLKHIIARRRNQKINIRRFLMALLSTFEKGFIIKDKKRIGNFNIEDVLNKIVIATKSHNKNRKFPVTSHPQNKSAAKRLAIWKPMSKPYVDSRFRFTTELHRLIDILMTKNKFVNSRLINILKRLYIYKSAKINRTPDIVSNYSEMTPSQTADIINSNKSAAKRLAILRPMSKPYVDSRSHFTTELYRIFNILSSNKIVNSQSAKNNINTKLRKVLLLLLLQQVIKNKKSVNKGQWQTNNNTISKTQNFQNFENKYPFQKQKQNKFQYLNNRYNSQNIINPNMNYSTLSNQIPTLYNERIAKSKLFKANGVKSILNSTTNSQIPQVSYNNLPEFKPLNVKLENVPVYNPNPIFYSTPNYNNNSSSGFGIDIGQLLEVGEALFDLWQSNNKRKQNQSNKNQQNQQNQQQQNIPVEQNYEFIPPSTYENKLL